jgi:hypothetical protein
LQALADALTKVKEKTVKDMEAKAGKNQKKYIGIIKKCRPCG